MEIFQNFPLWAALLAIFSAQGIKIPISFIASRKIDGTLAFSTGGMPSSHSAAVTALSTGIGIEQGFGSPLFALAAVFAIIVMFDSTGVRRQSGEQAIMLNILMNDFQRFVEQARGWGTKEEFEKREEIKEMLGHQPVEVFVGGVFGVVLTFFVHYLLF
ncbi:divergent PAP2 family protein [Salimicrobium flavidum]|nr:divergent PAP2 family protein [Salimicrobium flavidum]